MRPPTPVLRLDSTALLRTGLCLYNKPICCRLIATTSSSSSSSAGGAKRHHYADGVAIQPSSLTLAVIQTGFWIRFLFPALSSYWQQVIGDCVSVCVAFSFEGRLRSTGISISLKKTLLSPMINHRFSLRCGKKGKLSFLISTCALSVSLSLCLECSNSQLKDEKQVTESHRSESTRAFLLATTPTRPGCAPTSTRQSTNTKSQSVRRRCA